MACYDLNDPAIVTQLEKRKKRLWIIVDNSKEHKSGSHHLDQFFCFRPAFGLTRWRTHAKGLYMVGASTWPGAGTGAGSGLMLAKELVGAS